jgi:hypothetical protein
VLRIRYTRKKINGKKKEMV